MSADLSRVDFANIQEQASWVCQCDTGMVNHLEREYKRALKEQASLGRLTALLFMKSISSLTTALLTGDWAKWLQSVADKTLSSYEDRPDFVKAARQFLLRWSFYR